MGERGGGLKEEILEKVKGEGIPPVRGRTLNDEGERKYISECRA